MTHDTYDKFKKVQRAIFVELPKKHHEELQAERLKLMALKANCDHILPNGGTTIKDGKCSFCGQMMTTPMGAQSLRLKHE